MTWARVRCVLFGHNYVYDKVWSDYQHEQWIKHEVIPLPDFATCTRCGGLA